MTETKKQKIKEIISLAVDDGIKLALKRYAELKAKNFDSIYLPKHDDFPSISNYDSGLPYFSTTPSYFGFKISYSKILSDSKIDTQQPSWKNLLNFFLEDEEIYKYLEWRNWDPKNEETRLEVYTYFIMGRLRSLIDSIIHSVKNPKAKSKIKSNKINNWVSALTKETVNYELIVPIIIHQPDCTKIFLNKHVRIEKMDSNLQLSRNTKLPTNLTAHKNVVGAATHALYFSNILEKIPNKNQDDRYKIIDQKINANLDFITKIFSVLRLVVNDSVGFCQIIAKPIDFADDWNAHLPSINVFGFKKYPPYLENGGWFSKKIISKKQIKLFKEYFNKISDDKKIRLAKGKLFDSDLRNNYEDSVLDIATGLESLLSDSTDNLKYKISLRSAAICKRKKFRNFTPIEVKIGIKTFYDLRSAIIHGNTKNINKKRTIRINGFSPIDTLWFGKSVLMHLVQFFMFNNEFESIEDIDNYLLNN